jgi:hypothetical protein
MRSAILASLEVRNFQELFPSRGWMRAFQAFATGRKPEREPRKYVFPSGRTRINTPSDEQREPGDAD